MPVSKGCSDAIVRPAEAANADAETSAIAVRSLFPRLKPGPAKSREAAAAHQCARLHAAMIEACARNGYAKTTAVEVTTLAGVSKKTLYEHFGSKDGCFLSTYDLVVREAVRRISAAYRGEGDDDPDLAGGLSRAFGAFAAELVERPAPSRVALIDVLTVAPSASDRIERAEAAFATMISASLSGGSDGIVIPAPIVRALVGGVWFVSRRRLLDARPRAVAVSAAELGDWLLAYRSPAAALLPVVGPGAAVSASARRRSARLGDADGRFPAVLDWLSARAFAEALRASEAAPSWAAGVCRAVRALFSRLASDPALARAAFLDTVDSAGAERRAAIMSGFADALVRRAPAETRPSPLVAEAIVGSIWSIAQRGVASSGRRPLRSSWPDAAYVATAPIIGAEGALAAILDEAGVGKAIAGSV